MLSALVITGCDALEGNSMKITIEESEKTVNFANEADAEQNVTFTATAAWTATVSEDWLEVSPMSGESGSNVITIRTLSTNPDEAQRTAEISLTAGGDPETITVTQEGTDDDPSYPDEPGYDTGNFITKISIVEEEYAEAEYDNTTNEYYIFYDDNGKISDIRRYFVTTDKSSGEMTYYDCTYQHFEGSTVTVEVMYGDVGADAGADPNHYKFDFQVEFDGNGNALTQPYYPEATDDSEWVAMEYAEDNTLSKWTFTGTDTSNDDAREIRWENGNMTFLEGMCGTIVPSDTEAPETGFDLAFFLVSDNWLTPCSSYTGTFSKNLPASTDDGEGYTMKFEYESDDNGRLVKATESDNGVEYTFSYGEQTLPDYGIPEVTTK